MVSTGNVTAPREGIVFIPPEMQFKIQAQNAWESGKGRQIPFVREGGVAYSPAKMAAALAAGKPPVGITFLGKIDQTTEGAVFLFERHSQCGTNSGGQLMRTDKTELYGVSSQFLEANGGKQVYVMKNLGPGVSHGLPPGAVG
jgi:hypothetical protein